MCALCDGLAEHNVAVVVPEGLHQQTEVLAELEPRAPIHLIAAGILDDTLGVSIEGIL